MSEESVIENRPFFVYDSCRVAVSSVAKKSSFVEVAVAPISGQISPPHRMHVTNDEKKRACGKNSVINMSTRSVRTTRTCDLVEISFFALSHVPPVLLMDVGSWTLDTRTLDDKKPHKTLFQT